MQFTSMLVNFSLQMMDVFSASQYQHLALIWLLFFLWGLICFSYDLTITFEFNLLVFDLNFKLSM